MTGLVRALHRLRLPMFYSAALLLGGSGVAGRLVPDGPADDAVQVVFLAALGLLIAWLVVTLLGGRLRVEAEEVTVASPVRGRWLALNSPTTAVPSHGTRAYGQAFAVDLVAEPDGVERARFGSGAAFRRNAEYPAYGQPVHAMVSGVVVDAADRRRDHRARANGWALVYMLVEGMIRELGGPGAIVGNHVTIRTPDGTFALVAHLQRGSATVRTGDVVRAGDVVGLCGNSGNSSEPHVHAQLMDRRSLWTAAGVPMRFADVVIGDGAGPGDALPANEEHMVAGDVPARP